LARGSHLPGSPRWRLRGDTRRVGVATKSPRCNQKTLAGGTADDGMGGKEDLGDGGGGDGLGRWEWRGGGEGAAEVRRQEKGIGQRGGRISKSRVARERVAHVRRRGGQFSQADHFRVQGAVA